MLGAYFADLGQRIDDSRRRRADGADHEKRQEIARRHVCRTRPVERLGVEAKIVAHGDLTHRGGANQVARVLGDRGMGLARDIDGRAQAERRRAVAPIFVRFAGSAKCRVHRWAARVAVREAVGQSGDHGG